MQTDVQGGDGIPLGVVPALTSNAIPRSIVQVWLGPRPAPLEWMVTWNRMHPGWHYDLWNEARIERFGLRNARLYHDFLDAGVYDGASDVARVEILARFGGVYADADSRCLRPLDGAPFLRAGFFATREQPPDGSYFVTNAFMGCVPHHPLIERYVARLSRVRKPRKCIHGHEGAAFCCAWRMTGPRLLTSLLKVSRESDIRILAPWVFFPVTIQGEAVAGGDRAYARHYWSSTGERTADKTLFPAAVDY